MKKQYQIERQRAVQEFRRIATEQNTTIQHDGGAGFLSDGLHRLPLDEG